MIIINANALISGHPGGYYMGISQDLSTLFINLTLSLLQGRTEYVLSQITHMLQGRI